MGLGNYVDIHIGVNADLTVFAGSQKLPTR